jgi:hypothetical protein
VNESSDVHSKVENGLLDDFIARLPEIESKVGKPRYGLAYFRVGKSLKAEEIRQFLANVDNQVDRPKEKLWKAKLASKAHIL